MIETPKDTIALMEKIIAVAIFLQCLELFSIRKTFSEQGVWRWSVIRDDFIVFRSLTQRTLDFILTEKSFLVLISLRSLSAIVLFFYSSPYLLLFLFLSTVLISLRWRGTFNGGSDFMTLVVLMALCAAACFDSHPLIQKGALWYTALQVCNSYFLAGVVKIKHANWRSGRALIGFLNSTIYKPDRVSIWLTKRSLLAKAVSWSILIFECSFPLALLNSELCQIYLGLAFLFHVANIYIFGLNRFLYAWAAAYPALYFCSLWF